MGKTIADQNTELNNKLQSIASSKKVQFSAQLHSPMESTMEVYKSKKGKDFDNLYLDWVITSTQNNIDKYEKESEGIENKEIKQFGKNALPNFQQYDEAPKLKKQMKQFQIISGR